MYWYKNNCANYVKESMKFSHSVKCIQYDLCCTALFTFLENLKTIKLKTKKQLLIFKIRSQNNKYLKEKTKIWKLTFWNENKLCEHGSCLKGSVYYCHHCFCRENKGRLNDTTAPLRMMMMIVILLMLTWGCMMQNDV